MFYLLKTNKFGLFDEEIKTHYVDKNTISTLSNYISEILGDNTIIVCIGTDRCIGDSLGPIVGTLLKRNNFRYPVYGTLKSPIHAMNLKEELDRIHDIHKDPYIIAIDACLGDESYIGNIQIRYGPIYPGKGVGKRLPTVGDLSIVGIVDKFTNDDIIPIYNIRLSLVMDMAEVIVHSFIKAGKD